MISEDRFMQRPFDDVPKHEYVAKSEIQAVAAREIESLDLGNADDFHIIVKTIKKSDKDVSPDPIPIHYSVTAIPKADKFGIEGRNIQIDYFMNGDLLAVRMKWLPLLSGELRADGEIDADTITSRLLSAIQNHPLDGSADPLSMSVHVKIIDGRLRWVMRIMGILANGYGSGPWSDVEVIL